MNEEELERRSLGDLRTILSDAQKLGIKLVIIGGYAVASYTRGYRYTKDIDLVANKPTVGNLKGLLKNLGYSVRDTEFGIAGSKRTDRGFVDLHISVGRVFDVSTRKEYAVDHTLFEAAVHKEVKGYHSKTSSVKATVVDLETLILLKFIPIGRDKDAVDLISLLRDRRNDVNLRVLAERAKAAGLRDHLLSQVREYARRLVESELGEIWFTVTATRLSHREIREIRRFLANFANLLRKER